MPAITAEHYLKYAFEQVCKDAKPASGWYVSLMERIPRYGGPEEGGWWTSSTRIVSYQYFPTEEQAQAAQKAVEKMAEELSKSAKKEFGDHCLRQTEWLDERGLEDSFLPEVDGETEYFVLMSEEIPEESDGISHYE